MSLEVSRDASVITLVLRAWLASPPTQPRQLRFQATHVQTGEVSYFGTLDGVADYVKQLSDELVPRTPSQLPIDFSQRRRP
jgi:hypothetical protein